MLPSFLQAVFLYSEQQTPGTLISSKTYLNLSFLIWRLSQLFTEHDDSGGLSWKKRTLYISQMSMSQVTWTVLGWFPCITFTSLAYPITPSLINLELSIQWNRIVFHKRQSYLLGNHLSSILVLHGIKTLVSWDIYNKGSYHMRIW